MKEIISNDKRLCERLTLPIRIRYTRISEKTDTQEWSDYVLLDNIGGEGFGFASGEALSQGEKLKIEMTLPCEDEPFVIGAEVVRIEEGAAPQPDADEKCFFYGLKIFELQNGSKEKFEQFISDSIIDKYMGDEGELKDIES